MSDHDIIVIGAGPAGVAACRPLAESGARVLWLDAGAEPRQGQNGTGASLSAARRGDETEQHKIRPPLAVPGPDDAHLSPKLRLAAEGEFLTQYAEENALQSVDFNLVGTLGAGGLSRVWGAFAPAYDDTDFGPGPLTAERLRPSYQALARRIGISGSGDDDLGAYLGEGLSLQPAPELSPVLERLWRKYNASNRADGFKLGRARSAVLTEALGVRAACDLGGTCMWGCGRGAIYDAAAEVEPLAARPNVTYLPDILVEDIQPAYSGYSLKCRNRTAGRNEEFNSGRVVLAAGTLATTRLVLSFIGEVGAERQLFTNPSAAFALVDPAKLGRGLGERMFGLAQLCFRQSVDGDDHALGLLYDAAAFPASEIVRRIPVSGLGGVRLVRALLPTLAIGLLFFPGEYSANRVRLVDGSGATRLKIEGGYRTGFDAALRRAAKDIFKSFRRLGYYYVPSSLEAHGPGTECHYAGTLAHGRDTDINGEVAGVPGLFAVDGSVLPRLSAKHPTFTIMANAERIGRAIAERYF